VTIAQTPQHRSYLLDLRPATFQPAARRRLRLERCEPVAWQRAKGLWLDVGEGFWSARVRWSEARWQQHLLDPSLQFWAARWRGRDAGFFELVVQRRGVKIEGFGLLPALRGQGLGGPLLSAAVQAAFRLGAPRVWLHTATDDHPSALPNYLARGFRIYREQALKHPMPAPGAKAE
jgi:ribosomal protein S18 acetylase RimI-like enzyme